MNINVVQAQEDKYGNVKENIYLAFDEQNQYLGSGYVYPMINRHRAVKLYRSVGYHEIQKNCMFPGITL